MIIYKTGLHWLVFLKAITIFLAGVILYVFYLNYGEYRYVNYYIKIMEYVSYALLCIGGTSLLFSYLEKISTELVITSEKVVAKKGFLSIDKSEIQLRGIDSHRVRQNYLGRFFNYGTIDIYSGSHKLESVPDTIANPHQFLENLIKAKKNGGI